MSALNHLTLVLIFTTVVSGFINGDQYNASSEAESLPGKQTASHINETAINETSRNNIIGDVNETVRNNLIADVNETARNYIIGDVNETARNNTIGDVNETVRNNIFGEVNETARNNIIGDFNETASNNIIEDVNKTARNNIIGDVNETARNNIIGNVNETARINIIGEVNETVRNNIIGEVNETVRNNIIGEVNETARNNIIEDVNETARNNIIGDVNETARNNIIGDVNETARNNIIVEVNETVSNSIIGDVNETARNNIIGDVNETARNNIIGDVNETAGNNIIGDVNETTRNNIIGDVNITHNSERMGQNLELPSNGTEIKFPPTFKHPSKLYNMDMKPAGSSIRLNCAADGNPTPNITWSKKNGPIVRAYFQPSYEKWSMSLDELTKTDSGNYTCLVCNELGCINHTVALQVQERLYSKPVLTRGVVNQTKLVGETVHLSCEFLSDMDTHILWKYESVYDNNVTTHLENNSLMRSEDPDDLPENLTIFNVTKEYEGWYVCIGMNVLGITSTQGYLTVLDPLPVIAVPDHGNRVSGRYPSRPSVKGGYPGNNTALVHRTARLTCPILSDLDYFMYWLKPAKNYIGNGHVGAEEPIPEGLVIQSDDDTDKPEVLTLYNVTKEEKGWYICVALNTLGRTFAKGYLTVLDRNNQHNEA